VSIFEKTIREMLREDAQRAWCWLRETPSRWLRKTTARLFYLAVAALVFGGLGLFGWQVLHFLMKGTWEAVSVIDALRWATDGNAWTVYPQSWIGIWRILDALPASATGVVLGIIGVVVVGTIGGHERSR